MTSAHCNVPDHAYLACASALPACLSPLYRRDSKCVQLQRVLSVLWHNFIDSKGKQRRKQQRQSSSRQRQGTRRRQDEAEGREKEEQTARGASQADKQHTRAAAAHRVCSSLAVLAHCQCIQRDYFAVYFARVSFRAQAAERGEGGAWQLAEAYSILNFCHFAMSIVVVPPSPLLLAVGTKLAAFQQRCNICFVWLAAYPLHILPPNCSAPCTAPPSPFLTTLCTLAVGRKSPKILFIMSPYRQQQLCLSLHFGLLCLPHSSPRLPGSLFVFAELARDLPICQFTCAVRWCTAASGRGRGRGKPSLNEPQPLPAATSNYQFIFLACNSNVATWQRFAQLINFCAFLMAPPHNLLPLPPPH